MEPSYEAHLKPSIELNQTLNKPSESADTSSCSVSFTKKSCEGFLRDSFRTIGSGDWPLLLRPMVIRDPPVTEWTVCRHLTLVLMTAHLCNMSVKLLLGTESLGAAHRGFHV